MGSTYTRGDQRVRMYLLPNLACKLCSETLLFPLLFLLVFCVEFCFAVAHQTYLSLHLRGKLYRPLAQQSSISLASDDQDQGSTYSTCRLVDSSPLLRPPNLGRNNARASRRRRLLAFIGRPWMGQMGVLPGWLRIGGTEEVRLARVQIKHQACGRGCDQGTLPAHADLPRYAQRLSGIVVELRALAVITGTRANATS